MPDLKSTGCLGDRALKVLGEELRSAYASGSINIPLSLVELLQQLRRASTDSAGPVTTSQNESPTYPFEAEGCFDPSVVQVLSVAFAEAWPTLQDLKISDLTNEEFAQRLIKLAAQGERDPSRMGARAIVAVIAERGSHRSSNLDHD